ncbi:MAG: hypothetical protein M1514_03470 [Patescibacteria group bacterium]|nr:hypothetical protein [Patescibacteria group bacterium]
MIKRLFSIKLLILLLIFGGLFFLSWFLNSLYPGMIGGLDWPIPPQRQQIISWFLNSLYTWTEANTFTGQPQQPLSLQLSPLLGFFALLAALGFNGEILTKFLLGLFFVGGGLSIYALLRHFKINFVASIIGSVLYLITPFSLDWILIGGVGEFLGLYAFLPLSILIFFKLLEQPKNFFKWLFLLLLMTFFYPLYSVILQSIIFFSYAFFDCLILKQKKIRDYLKFFLSFYLSYFLFHAPWILLVLFNPAGAAGGMNFSISVGEVIRFLDIFRLWSKLAPFFEMSISDGGRILRISRRFCSFGLPMLAFFGLLLNWKNNFSRYFATIIVIILGITTNPLTYFMIEKNILFFGIFRHVNKFYPLISLSYAFLLALAINNKEENFFGIKLRIIKKIYFGLIIIFFTVYYLPFLLSGNFNGYLRLVNYSKDYDDLNKSFEIQKSEGKVLWLPTGSGYLKPEDRKDESWVSDYFANHFTLGGGINEINYRFKYVPELWLNNLLYSSASEDVSSLGRILGILGVSDLVLRNQTEITQWAIPMFGDIWSRKTNDLRLNLDRQTDLLKSEKYNSLTILHNQNNFPQIYAGTSKSLISGSLNVLLALNNLPKFDFSKNIISFVNDIDLAKQKESNFQEIIIEKNNYNDLIFAQIEKQYKIPLTNYIKSQNSLSGWTDLHQLAWWFNNDYQATLDKPIFTRGNNAKIEFPLNIDKEDEYLFFINGYQGLNNGTTTLVLSANETLKVMRASFYDFQEDGYVWKDLGKEKLNPGKYKLLLNSNDENVIASIVIVPKKTFEKSLAEEQKLLQQKKLLLFNEFWDFNNKAEFTVPKAAFYELLPLGEGFVGLFDLHLDGQNLTTLPKKIWLSEGRHEFTFSTTPKTNLISNPSFETDEPSAPYVYDGQSDLLRYQPLRKKFSEEATQGNYSLKITSSDYQVPLLKTIKDFFPDSAYLISFDYKNIKGESLNFAVLQSRRDSALSLEGSEEDLQATFQWPQKLLKKDSYWQRHEEIVNFFPGIKQAGLLFNSVAKGGESVNLLDNINLSKIKKYRFALSEVDREITSVSSLPLTFTKISPTQYRVWVEKSQQPYFLVLGETFDSRWKAYPLKEKNRSSLIGWFDQSLPEERHFQAQAYANGWEILPGDLGNSPQNEIILEFEPQRIVWLGFVFTGFILVILIAAVIKETIEK